MQYNRMGKSGLRLSELGYGAWITLGRQTDFAKTRAIMRRAFEAGINFFDNAEGYAAGAAESLMGEVLRDFRRSDVVVSTKIFHGGNGPNDTGLSWKHLIEGTHASLQRLRLDYVDLLFCHRPDPNTPIEETVRAMDVLVRQGKVFYWGTSEWPADQIESAIRIARELGAAPPCVEQPQYNLLHRHRVEVEYAPLFERHGLGTTTWSPLASGLLTGKYDQGIPKGSRLDLIEWLRESMTKQSLERARGVAQIARELGCTSAQLAIAWCLRNPAVSSVLLGVSRLEQLEENLGALQVKARLDASLMERLNRLAPVAVETGGAAKSRLVLPGAACSLALASCNAMTPPPDGRGREWFDVSAAVMERHGSDDTVIDDGLAFNLEGGYDVLATRYLRAGFEVGVNWSPLEFESQTSGDGDTYVNVVRWNLGSRASLLLEPFHSVAYVDGGVYYRDVHSSHEPDVDEDGHGYYYGGGLDFWYDAIGRLGPFVRVYDFADGDASELLVGLSATFYP